MAYQPISSYGVIGDMHSIALVGSDGSIDWLCLPRFDSPSVFASILDYEKGGYFRIQPVGDGKQKQMYLTDTNVLVTRFLSQKAWPKSSTSCQLDRKDDKLSGWQRPSTGPSVSEWSAVRLSIMHVPAIRCG